MRLHQYIVDLARRAYDLGKVVTAVCYSPQRLISADVVRGRRLTSWASVAMDVKNYGAIWVDKWVIKVGILSLR